MSTTATKLAELHPDLQPRVRALIAAAPWPVGITSAYRSSARQAELYAAYLAGTGNPANKPGTSKHETTLDGRPAAQAADLAFPSDTARRWAHANRGTFGLRFPYAHEPWHVESDGRPFQQEDDLDMTADQARQLAETRDILGGLAHIFRNPDSAEGEPLKRLRDLSGIVGELPARLSAIEQRLDALER